MSASLVLGNGAAFSIAHIADTNNLDTRFAQRIIGGLDSRGLSL